MNKRALIEMLENVGKDYIQDSLDTLAQEIVLRTFEYIEESSNTLPDNIDALKEELSNGIGFYGEISVSFDNVLSDLDSDTLDAIKSIQ